MNNEFIDYGTELILVGGAMFVGLTVGKLFGYKEGWNDYEELCAPESIKGLKELCQKQEQKIEELKHKERVVEVVR